MVIPILREAPDDVDQKSASCQLILLVFVVPMRVIQMCPVWQLHEIYSDESTKQWVQQGCCSAGIGCLECKSHHQAINAELEPIRVRAREYEETQINL